MLAKIEVECKHSFSSVQKNSELITNIVEFGTIEMKFVSVLIG